MKITLSKDTRETLWIFTKMGMRVIIRRRCENCKEWVKLTVRRGKR